MSKEDKFFLFFLLLISSLLCFGLFKSGIFSSHDGEVHIARIAQAATVLREGQLPLRWLSNWNFGYGYPTFVYVYSLPYYFAFALTFIFSSFEVVFKTLLFLSVVLSALSFYLVARSTFTPIAAFIGALFYTSAPYRFADIYERGALGEALSFIFTPVLFFSPHLIKKHKKIGPLLLIFSVFALITTHALTFPLFIVPTVLYSFLVLRREIRLYVSLTFSILIGFLLSSFGWVPMVLEQNYLKLNETYYNLYSGHLISLYQLLRIPHEGINIGTGIQLGTAQLFILSLSIATILTSLFFKSKKINHLTVYLVVITVISAFLATSVSTSLWDTLTPLRAILFPWRFLTLTTFATAVLACLFVSSLKKNLQKTIFTAILALFAIIPSRHYMVGYKYQTFPNDYYSNYQDRVPLDNYFLPKSFNVDLQKKPLAEISLIAGSGQVTLVDKKSNHIKVNTSFPEESQVLFHTMYFPGHQLFIDGKKSELTINHENLQGLIVAKVPTGNHRIDLKFTETPVRKAGNVISLATLIIFLIFLINHKFNLLHILSAALVKTETRLIAFIRKPKF